MNSTDPSATHDFVPFTDAERRELEVRFYLKGEMPRYAEWVLDLVKARREEILRLSGGPADEAALLLATQRVIGERGSVNHAAELRDQIKEMEKELWYRGEKGDHDHAGIKLEWTVKYAADWRRERIREYQYVAEHYRTHVVSLLRRSTNEPERETARVG